MKQSRLKEINNGDESGTSGGASTNTNLELTGAALAMALKICQQTVPLPLLRSTFQMMWR